MKKYKGHILLSILLTALLMTERFLVPIDTFSLITSVIGLTVLAIVLRTRTQKRNVLGVKFELKQLPKSILYAVVVPVASVLIVLALEQIIWKLSGHSGFFIRPAQNIFFGDYRIASVWWVGKQIFLRWMWIGVGATLVRSLFLEFTFRGLNLYQGVTTTNPITGNILQAFVFVFVMGVPPIYGLLKSYLNGEMIPGKEWSYIVGGVAILLYFFLMGYRHGELRLLCESILPCILSCWICDFTTEVINAASFWPAHLSPFSSVFRMLFIQIVACALSIPMILRNKKENQQKFQKPTDDRSVDTEKIVADILRHSEQE